MKCIAYCDGCRHLVVRESLGGDVETCAALDRGLDHWWSGNLNERGHALREHECKRDGLWKGKRER